MSKDTPTVITNSVPYFPVLPLLGAVLTILKVLGKITLAWKWVLAPFWIPALLGLGILGVVILFAIAAAVVAALVD